MHACAVNIPMGAWLQAGKGPGLIMLLLACAAGAVCGAADARCPKRCRQWLQLLVPGKGAPLLSNVMCGSFA